MLTDNQLHTLRAPFPTEALTTDMSRGFELTSIKAAYVIERLNDVFGPAGWGWRYTHAEFEVIVTADQRTEIITEVALQYRISDDQQRGCGPVEWYDHGWRMRPDHPWHWSEPVFAVGGRCLGRGNAPYTDARKSAVTDGLTKAASMLGVGHEVFKGQIRLSGGNGHNGNDGNGHHGAADATAFWSLYNRKGKDAGIALEVAKDLAGRGNWEEALQELSQLIQEAVA